MKANPFHEGLAQSDEFLVTVELLTSPRDGIDSYLDFFKAFSERYQPKEGHPKLVGVTSPQSPGGVPTMDPFVVWSDAQGTVPDGLAPIAHVTCKDLNRNGLESHLRNLSSVGVDSVLALTGDYPQHSKPVFELDSISLLRLIMDVNGQIIGRTKPEELDDAPQFVAGAGMNPYKYSLASAWQQYSKMLKKVMSGAAFIITQVGYDVVKSEELIRYARAHEADVPLFGNVYLLTKTAVARMNGGELPGCYASDALCKQVESEWKNSRRGRKAAIERMAYQTAMFRRQGYRGVHLGGWGLTYDDVETILGRAQELHEGGFDDEEARARCHFPPPDAEYFIDEDGEFNLPERAPKPTLRERRLTFVHDHVTDPDSFIGKRLRRVAESDPDRKGLRARALYSIERASKAFLVQCRDCGDCRLPDNYYALCHEAACPKGVTNLPCGDSDAITGRCGNDPDVLCAGELVFYAAFARGKLGELASQVQSSKIADLRGSSAVLNYLAGIDHRGRIAGQLRRKKTLPLTIVGESIHAQIPRVFWAMDQVRKHPNGRMSGALAYLSETITSQVIAGSDYIAINVDQFPKDIRPDLMRYYVDLVNSLSDGVPVCVDSSDVDTKAVGVAQYYRTARDPDQMPLVNSINMMNPKPILELRSRYPFKVVAMLHETVDESGVPRALETVEEVHALALEMFKMLQDVGFRAEDIFFDTAVVPIATDIEAKRTHQTMHGIRAIASDPTLVGTRTLIGLSNCSHMMPNRLAINRAYLQLAMDYGLTAAVLDPRVNYGEKTPGKQIMSIIHDLAENDGTDMMKGFEIFERVAEYSRKYGKANR